MPARGHDAHHGRIGPNAIIRTAEALADLDTVEHRRNVFAAAGLDHYFVALPADMVPEAEVCRLNSALRQVLGEEQAHRISSRAGSLTGDYLLAHRIPKAAQKIIRILPQRLGLRVLISAVQRNSWTFVGTGEFVLVKWKPLVIEIVNNPICRGSNALKPACGFYAATFERLFRALIRRDFRFEETSCTATGASRCRFEEI